jgi:putative hydrolase of the HAD superfamily
VPDTPSCDARLREPASTPGADALQPLAAGVDCWLFDMDNTLYPASANLFAQIDLRMEAFIQRLLGLGRAEARAVQKRYFHEHGTTLRGLMLSHGVEPREFLDFVHDVDVSVLAPDHALADALARLPGRKMVFTNGDLPYAERVLTRLGILDRFDAIHDIHAMDYHPKPDPRPYAGLCEAHGIDPARALFVEDMAHNLKPAKALGMRTVWVNNGSERGSHGACPSFIDAEIARVTPWLEDLLP